MIEHKTIDTGDFKTTGDLDKELDKLANYEGFLIVCARGKHNDKLVLRRILEYPQQQEQQIQQAPAKSKGVPKQFPDAVFQ